MTKMNKEAKKATQSTLLKLDNVPVPPALNENQAYWARRIVSEQHDFGRPISWFFRNTDLVQSTYYHWRNNNDDFNTYFIMLQEEVTAISEAEAYSIVQQKVIDMVTTGKISRQEVQLFLELFPHLPEIEKRKRLIEQGIITDNLNGHSTLEERRNSLLSRLQGNK